MTSYDYNAGALIDRIIHDSVGQQVMLTTTAGPVAGKLIACENGLMEVEQSDGTLWLSRSLVVMVKLVQPKERPASVEEARAKVLDAPETMGQDLGHPYRGPQSGSLAERVCTVRVNGMPCRQPEWEH